MSRRPIVKWGVGLCIVAQLVLPLSYYMGEQREDERFAWRMFSAVRMSPCKGGASATLESGARVQIQLVGVAHVAWIALLQRNRARVVHRFLEDQCAASEGYREVTYWNTCNDLATQSRVEHRYEMTCATRQIGYEVKR